MITENALPLLFPRRPGCPGWNPRRVPDFIACADYGMEAWIHLSGLVVVSALEIYEETRLYRLSICKLEGYAMTSSVTDGETLRALADFGMLWAEEESNRAEIRQYKLVVPPEEGP